MRNALHAEILVAKNFQYEEREQLDSGSGGALSQAAGHAGRRILQIHCIAIQKQAVHVHQKTVL